MFFLHHLLVEEYLHADHKHGQEAAALIPQWEVHSMGIQQAGVEDVAEDVELIAVVVVEYIGVDGKMEEVGEIDGSRHK